jgi:ectoine hydroxylase-related dioxygenase (phytanoyl-CoA dioxygenase family)
MAVLAPEGSLVVWHGNTWHGAVARTSPGLRISLILYFCRPYLVRQECYTGVIPTEVFERNSRRLRDLVGVDLPFPIKPDGIVQGRAPANRR